MAIHVIFDWQTLGNKLWNSFDILTAYVSLLEDKLFLFYLSDSLLYTTCQSKGCSKS